MTYPTISPSLTLDFAKSKQLDPRIAFTRASTGTYLDSDGLIKTASSGVARFEYDSSGKALGLLIEDARTNYCEYSQIDSTNWTQGGTSSLSASAVSAPDGGACFDLTTDSGGPNSVRLVSSSSPTGTVALSVFARFPNTGFTALNIRMVAVSGGVNFYADFYPATESFSGLINCTGSFESFANGWYKITIVSTVSSSSGSHEFRVGGGIGSSSFTAQTCQVWGAQIEAGAFPTSYIPTSGSTATRSADLATMPTAGIYGDEFTTINKDFGTVGGSDTLTIVGPNAERTVVYPEHLTQAEINEVATSDDDGFWRWRVLGSSFALTGFRTDGSLTVDWGDGTVETLTTAEHTFSNGSGYHEIGFRLDSGTYFSPNFNGNVTNAEKVISVGPFPSNMLLEYRPFGLCRNMEVCDATFAHTGTSAQYLFRQNRKLKSIPFFTTTATDLKDAFNDCEEITSFPLIDTSSVTLFTRAWRDCDSLTSFPLIDTSSGTNFQEAWYNCNSITSFPLIDTSSGTNFAFTWRQCSSLTSFPLIDTSSGTSFAQAWNGCSGLTSFPLIDTSSGTSFDSAWSGCTNLTSFPLINTSSGTDFRYAWNGCSSLTSFPLIDTSSSTGSFTDTWNGCSSLTSFPAIVCNGNSYNEAWRGCTNLANFPANMFDSTPITVGQGHGTSWHGAWRNCALTAQSIENILVSLDTNGASNCSLGIQGGTNAGQSTWTSAATTAYNNLITKGWAISSNP